MHRQVFYESESLGRLLYIKDLQSLNRKDLKVLEKELIVATSSMQDKMHEERDTGDTDWLHKLSMKLKICEQFLARLGQIRDNDLSRIDTYHLSYFRQAVSNLIGPLQADQLFEKTRSQAIVELNKEVKS
tara:strand:- start:1374 stop:1763 length:390 start_codon:yes stop_codon:yes gene_type:complete